MYFSDKANPKRPANFQGKLVRSGNFQLQWGGPCLEHRTNYDKFKITIEDANGKTGDTENIKYEYIKLAKKKLHSWSMMVKSDHEYLVTVEPYSSVKKQSGPKGEYKFVVVGIKSSEKTFQVPAWVAL